MADILVPTLGESVSTATVARWLKQAGEKVAADEPLVELETDKVTQEVPAPAAGVLSEIVLGTYAEAVPGAVSPIGTAGARHVVLCCLYTYVTGVEYSIIIIMAIAS